MAVVKLELDDSVPLPIRNVLATYGLALPDEGSEDDNEVYERGRAGCCMTCGAPLGAAAMVTLAQNWVVMIYCGGACYSDMQVLGWLQEQHDEHVAKIKFRGGQIDGDGPEDD